MDHNPEHCKVCAKREAVKKQYDRLKRLIFESFQQLNAEIRKT